MAHRAAAGRRVRRGGFRTGVPETLRLPGAYRFTLPDDLLQHIFASSYPAQYYSYTWSAVLDTDAFAAFTGTGDIFDSETARRYRRHILTEAGYDEPLAQYVRFRGAVPDVKPLMRRYGLAE